MSIKLGIRPLWNRVFLIVSIIVFLTGLATADNIFEGPFNTSTGDHPYSVCSCDFDGNGYPDIAAANNLSNNVVIRLNNGDSTFAPATFYNVGYGPRAICDGDLDGDEDIDLVVANYDSSTISILFNNGDGTFADSVNYASGNNPIDLCCDDINGDGSNDIVVLNKWSNDWYIFMNHGDGTFAPPVIYDTYESPTSICAKDLDGDEDIDLAVGSYRLTIRLNNGDGTFSGNVHYVGCRGTSAICSCDMDGDGDNDIATSNGGDDNASVFLNNGDGTFTAAVTYDVGDSPRSICYADFDRDGHIDLASPFQWKKFYPFVIAVLLGNGDGTFRTAEYYCSWGSGPQGPGGICCSDLDCDMDEDLIVVNNWSNYMSIMYNLTVPVSTTLQAFSCMHNIGGIEVSWKLSESSAFVEFHAYREKDRSNIFLPFDVDIVDIDAYSFKFTDTTCEPGCSYRYKIDASEKDGARTLFITETITFSTPILSLFQNHPNPFNPVTTIEYYLPAKCVVWLDVYDVSGKHIVRLAEGIHDSGPYAIDWNGINKFGKQVNSGVYLYNLKAGKTSIHRKMVMLR
jgi:hypothetical protein